MNDDEERIWEYQLFGSQTVSLVFHPFVLFSLEIGYNWIRLPGNSKGSQYDPLLIEKPYFHVDIGLQGCIGKYKVNERKIAKRNKKMKKWIYIYFLWLY